MQNIEFNKYLCETATYLNVPVGDDVIQGPLRDLAKSAAVAFVASPPLSRSSAMHLSRGNPYFMRSVTFCSVKGSDSTTAVAGLSATAEAEVEAEEAAAVGAVESCFRRFDSCGATRESSAISIKGVTVDSED